MLNKIIKKNIVTVKKKYIFLCQMPVHDFLTVDQKIILTPIYELIYKYIHGIDINTNIDTFFQTEFTNNLLVTYPGSSTEYVNRLLNLRTLLYKFISNPGNDLQENSINPLDNLNGIINIEDKIC